MNLKEMSFDRQVKYLRSLLRSGNSLLTGYLALFAFRHHLIMKHSPKYSLKPVLRWYLGQLARTYITKYFNEAKAILESMSETGLLEVKGSSDDANKEYHLNDTLYPALRDVLEEVFGKEYISNAISKAKYYRDPDSRAYDEKGKDSKNSRRKEV